jgi:hypothetical protein
MNEDEIHARLSVIESRLATLTKETIPVNVPITDDDRTRLTLMQA